MTGPCAGSVDPPGDNDHLLAFSAVLTGALIFAPSFAPSVGSLDALPS